MTSDPVSLSVVSHGQGPLVRRLLEDIERDSTGVHEVILTENIPEPSGEEWKGFNVPITVIRNACAKGFGANHNTAFSKATGSHFCVLNPDVRFPLNPFPALLEQLACSGAGVVAPLIVNSAGHLEDSARRFPSPFSLTKKALGLAPRIEYTLPAEPFSPDWIAGMFMLFQRNVFDKIGGFDERYFLYYEDIDLCARLRLAGYPVRVVPSVRAIHDAQRRSHWDPKYLRWHLQSIVRFFVSDTYRGVMRQRRLAERTGQ